MATVTLGNSYRFKDYNNNKYLNILVSGNPTNNSNVTIYSLDANDMAQVWQCVSHSAAGVSGALMKSVKNTNLALDRYRGSSNYNNADVYTVGTTAADLQDQLVEFIPISNGYYRIKLVYADLYLTVSTVATYGGYDVKWQALTGNADQLWLAELYSVSSSATPDPTPSEIRDKEFFVKAYGTNLNLNVYGTDTVANARNVNVYTKENCLAQKWIAKQTSAGPKLFTKINEAYALNINTADNNCTMYTAAGNDDDSVLEFEPVADMLYRIKMFRRDKYLVIDGSTSGSNVSWTPYMTLATYWEFIPEEVMFPPASSAPDAPTAIVNNTYAVQANGTEFYLNVYGTDTVVNDRNVNIYSKEDCQAQRWVIKNVEGRDGAKMYTKIDENFALNIYTVDNNCTMYTDTQDNDTDSLLEFVPAGNMLYKIKMFSHDKYLCIDGAVESGANVKWAEDASTATVWKFIPEATAFPAPEDAPASIVNQTFFIKNFNTGFNLNVHGNDTVADGRNVNLYAKENVDAQKWRVINTERGPKIVTEITSTTGVDFALNITSADNPNCNMFSITGNNMDSVLEFEPYIDAIVTAEDKVYKIKMSHHGKYLDAAGVGSGYNAYWSETPLYPLWQFVTESEMFPPAAMAPTAISNKTFFVQNVNTGYYLNVHGVDTVANTRNVNVYAKEDVKAQRWVIRNGTGGPKLHTKIDEDFALNIYANDNNCTMYKEEGNDIDSVLEFIPYTAGQTEASENIYRIKMHYHNRYLTVANRNIGSNAYWTAVDTEPYALWKLIPEDDMSFDSSTDTDTTPDSSLVSVYMPAHTNNYMIGRAGNSISEITIHHTGAVAASVERIGDDWQDPARGASSHYCVRGTRVGQFVKECNTAYTNGGSLKNPNAGSPNLKAVTIETCNSTGDPTWEVSDDTYYTLVRLVADIARRNNLGTLVPGENLTWHSMYAYTACPGPYLLSRMQDIADRANEINAAYISGRVYLRKHNTDKFFSVDINNNIVLADKGNAKPWLLENKNGKTNICDFANPTLKMNVDTDGTTLILTEGDSNVYASFLTEKTFDICYESSTSISSRRSSAIKKFFAAIGNFFGLRMDGECDHINIVADVNEEVDSFTSVVPEFYQNRFVKIKHKATGKYMTYTGETANLTNGYGISVELKDKVGDSSDPSQIWKITRFGDNMFCLSTYSATNHSLELSTDNNICVSTNPGMYVPNSRVVSISEIATDEFTISFPTFGKYCAQYFDGESATDYICGSTVSDSDAVWILEEPDPILLENWLRIYYNPQEKHAGATESREIIIPNYAFYIPYNYLTYDKDKSKYTFLGKDEDGNTKTYYINSYYVMGDLVYVTSFDAETMGNIENGTQIPKHDIPFTFTNRNRWGVVGKYANLSWNVSKFNHIEATDAISGLKVDENNFYWVAIGPEVIIENYPVEGRPSAELYNKGTIDVVLKKGPYENASINDETFYLHCSIGDIKAHTWNNGVFQTGFEYWNNNTVVDDKFDMTNRSYKSTVYDSWDNYNSTACVEFIGSIKPGLTKDFVAITTQFYEYYVEKIIFYPY